jgi:SAM-dependent methyltransferase
MGAEVRRAAKAAVGELVIETLAPEAAYRMWSATYDRDFNPLLALERRMLEDRLGIAPGDSMIDLATGTGRWLQHALALGARAFGIDASPEMLHEAANKCGARRLVHGDVCSLPFAAGSFELAICAFGLSYFPRIDAVFREVARVARRVIVSDLHPDAEGAGWSRSFRAGGQTYQIEHRCWPAPAVVAAARASGLLPSWSLDVQFGESEREIFERAGKAEAFVSMRRIRALRIGEWVRA